MELPIHVVTLLSGVQLFATPWTVAHQASLSMGFPRQEYWSGLPFPSSRDLPHPGIEPVYPELADEFFTTDPPGKPTCTYTCLCMYKIFLKAYTPVCYQEDVHRHWREMGVLFTIYPFDYCILLQHVLFK